MKRLSYYGLALILLVSCERQQEIRYLGAEIDKVSRAKIEYYLTTDFNDDIKREIYAPMLDSLGIPNSMLELIIRMEKNKPVMVSIEKGKSVIKAEVYTRKTNRGNYMEGGMRFWDLDKDGKFDTENRGRYRRAINICERILREF
ncbi:hypothetical protein HYT57_04285 [Candidatus Woesearchaeota archaeon]|nr:hypothetical protein [Candidatus Woesearchaeota archaeon]